MNHRLMTEPFEGTTMLESGKISHIQFSILVALYVIGSSILLMPSAFVAKANQDAWLAAILGVGISTLFVLLYNALGSSFPTLTLAEYNEKILGKWLGKFISLLYFTYFFLISALVLRNMGDFIVTHILRDTPIGIIEIIFLLVVIMGVHLGLETFSRTSELVFPWVVLLFFMLVVFLIPQIKFLNFQPILEKGIKPVINGSLPYIGTPTLELVAFLMLFPYVNRTKNSKRAFLVGNVIGGTALIIVTMLSVFVLGVTLTSSEIYPTYILATKINVGNFLERIEAVVAVLWIFTIFIKLTVCFYASSLCLAQTLNLKEYRFLLVPLGMVMVALSLVAYPNSVYFQTMIGSIWFPYAFIYGGIIPIVLLLVGKLRKLPKSP